MTTPAINVARYSALLFGLFYGIYHQSTLSSAQRQAAVQRKYRDEESLIAQAKAEYLKKTRPEIVREGGDVITDPNDPKFDLEAYLTMSEGDEAKAKH